MITGTTDLRIRWGAVTPIAQIPTPDFAVPYAEPRSFNVKLLVIKVFTSENEGGYDPHEPKEESSGLIICGT